MRPLSKRNALIVGVLCGFLWAGNGCRTPDASDSEAGSPTESDVAGAPESAPAGLLPFPYRAEQIRDTMTLGFEAETLMVDPSTRARQRWTVVAWDPEGVVIEYTPLDETGVPAGESVRSRSGWVELRDHASFPLVTSVRNRDTRSTDLGERTGWSYVVEDPKAGTVTTFFFADDFPGAPLWMQTRRGDEILMTMTQIRRSDV